MNSFLKTQLTLIAFSVFLITTNAQINQQTDQYNIPVFNDSIEVIEPFSKGDIEVLLKKHNINGASIAFINFNKDGWTRAYGFADSEKKIPIEPTTQFQAASVSKVFSALAMLNLVEVGHFDLNQDLRGKIESYGITNKFPETIISLRNLLKHKAGINYYGLNGYSRNAPLPSIEQVIAGEKPANNKEIMVLNEPYKTSKYSEGSYVILEKLINDKIRERANPIPFGPYINSIAQELKMKRTSVGAPIDTIHIAYGHSEKGKRIEGKFLNYPENAAGGIWTTAKDLALLAHEMGAYKNNTNTILNKELAEEFATDGIGVSYNAQKKFVVSYGSNEGYSCQFSTSLNQLNSLVIMTNSENSSAFIYDVFQLIEKQLLKKEKNESDNN